MKIKKIPLLAQIIAAIILGVICGNIFPEWLSKIFATINGIFSNLLSFIIPLLILGLIAPGIADVGKNYEEKTGLKPEFYVTEIGNGGTEIK